MYGTKVKKTSDACYYGVKKRETYKKKDGWKLCSCTAIANAFEIGSAGTVERARRQK
jgi:hypothetical protein